MMEASGTSTEPWFLVMPSSKFKIHSS